MTFVDTVFGGFFVFLIGLRNSFNAFVIWNVCIYFMSTVTRRLSLGITFAFSNFLRKSCVSLAYDGISLTMG